MAYKYTLTGKIIGYRLLTVHTTSGGTYTMRIPEYSESSPLTLTKTEDTSINRDILVSQIQGNPFYHYYEGSADSKVEAAIKSYVSGLFASNAFGRLVSSVSYIDRPATKYIEGHAYTVSGDEQTNYEIINRFYPYSIYYCMPVKNTTGITNVHLPYITGSTHSFTYEISAGELYGASSVALTLFGGVLSVYYIYIPGLQQDGTAGGIRIALKSSGTEYVISNVSLYSVVSGSYGVTIDGDFQTISKETVLLGEFTADSSAEVSDDTGYSGGTKTTSPTGSRNPWQTSGNGGIQGGDGTHTPYGGSLETNLGTTSGSYWANATDAMADGVHVWKLTSDQVAGLFDVFWEDNFIDTLSKLFSGNIENCVLSLYTTQFNAVNRGTAAKLYLGNFDTGLTAQQVSSVTKRSGTISIDLPEVSGSVADYESTTLYIYLPYVGFQQLDPSKYMGTGIQIDIYLDFMRGIVAYWLYGKTASGVDSDGDWTRGNTMVLDIFTASMKNDIPIGSAQFANMISGINSVINGVAGIMTGASALGDPKTAGYGFGAMIGGATAVSSGIISAGTPTYQTVGGIGGGMGLITPFRIFCTVFRNVDTTPANKADFVGGPSHQSVERLSQLSGFVKCETAIIGGGVPLDYKEDILQQLRSGVYI